MMMEETTHVRMTRKWVPGKSEKKIRPASSQGSIDLEIPALQIHNWKDKVRKMTLNQRRNDIHTSYGSRTAETIRGPVGDSWLSFISAPFLSLFFVLTLACCLHKYIITRQHFEPAFWQAAAGQLWDSFFSNSVADHYEPKF